MAQTPFVSQFDAQPGRVITLSTRVRRITARNASPMTFSGTNTYIVGTQDLAVIDPGPEDSDHLTAILTAVGARQSISQILITHSHVDHSPLAARLSDATGAKISAFGDSQSGRSDAMRRLAQNIDLGGGEGVDVGFTPDHRLADGTVLKGHDWTLTALHTPGHFPNHLCFALTEEEAVFTGDHVMGWSTTLVSPPDGDMSDFVASLELLQQRQGDICYHPGHGPAINEPRAMLAYQIAHRAQREQQILAALAEVDGDPTELAGRIYVDINHALLPAAARNVLAHLIDLAGRNLVKTDGDISRASIFRSV